MRIIAGTARGRRLCTPGKGGHVQKIRPTADRAREALFSIIGRKVVGAPVLDLFAGTGAMGLEALSRGADAAVFVDCHQEALALIRKNIELCGFSDRSLLLKRDLAKGLFFLKQASPAGGFEIIFLDPPYGRQLGQKVLQELGEGGILSASGLVVAEEEAGAEFDDSYGILRLHDRRRYGDTGFWLYRREERGIQ